MASCNHITLELLPEQKNKLRCRACHLTINPEELRDGCCPECYEMRGEKRDEFEEMNAEKKAGARYRCLECGIIINSQ